MEIRLLKENDVKQLRELLIKSYKTSFENVYPQSWIEQCLNNQSEERLLRKIEKTHFYVAVIDNKFVGSGAIGDYYGKLDESCLFSFCVAPEHQKQGIGKKIMEQIEKDEYFIRAKRIVCPSSIVALPFYLKQGFTHLSGVLAYEDGSFMLEKFNN